jgi:hypothetical protein
VFVFRSWFVLFRFFSLFFWFLVLVLVLVGGVVFFLRKKRGEVVTTVPISISLPTEIHSFHDPNSSSQHGAPHDAKAFALERTNERKNEHVNEEVFLSFWWHSCFCRLLLLLLGCRL